MNTPPPPDIVRDEYAALPPDAQYAAAQFIAFLRRPSSAKQNGKSATPAAKRRKPHIPFAEEPIVGMWKGRADMEDSVEYIRQLRKREFRESHA